MKIAYFATIRLPTEKAHGIQIMKLCEALALAGHEVTLVTPYRRNTIHQDTFEYYGVRKNFVIKQIPIPDFIDFGRKGFILHSLFFGLAIFFYILYKRPKLVYSRDDIALYFASFTGVQFCYEAHVNRYNYCIRRILKRAAKIVTISSGLKRFYHGKGVPFERIAVAPSGVEISDFNLRMTPREAQEKCGLPLDKIIIGYTGTFKTMGVTKGIETVIDALCELPENIYFIAVGGNPKDVEEYRQYAARKGVAFRTFFKDRVPTNQLALYQQASEVLLMPFPALSHYTEYMSPVKMFEYMASDRPIVASRLSAITEVLSDETAYFFTPGNTHELAQGILKVIESKKDAQEKSTAAFLAVKDYTWENRIKKIVPTVSKKVLFLTSDMHNTNGWGRYSLDIANAFQKKDIQTLVLTGTADSAHGEGAITLPSPLSLRKNFLSAFFLALRIYFKYRNEKITHIHAIVETYACTAYFIALFLGVPFIVTAHGSFALKTLSHPVYKKFQEKALKKAATIVAISNYTKKRLLQKIPDLQNIVVIPNGVDPAFLHTSAAHTQVAHSMISVGALKHRKGFHVVLEALPLIIKKIPDVHYYIIGNDADVKYTSRLHEIISAKKVEKYVTFLKDISDEELKRRYLNAGLFVLTPISNEYDFEGFGLVYLEANACGLPTIGSYENGGEDAIKVGVTGYLTRPEDIEDVAAKVTMVLSDPVGYNKLSSNARIFAETMTWDKIVEYYIHIL